jgi:glyoxylase-like metal-dependent hydrolase (beta-lactamase superfamily II)
MQIETIDLHYRGVSRVIASYLVMGPGGPVLVETGPGSTLDVLLAGLKDHGVAPADVRHVLVTHIHLDHAGAAGWWARQGATVYVHPFGAPHLVDPSKLIASASRIYKDEMEALWGEILPAPPERVVPVQDGQVIAASGLSFTAIETPGHARHHHVFHIGGVVFTGDAAGIRFPDSPWVDVPAPPPEFDLETWKTTIDRIRELDATTLYPTHYGATEEVAIQLDGLQVALEEVVGFVQSLMDEGLDRDQMVERYSLRLRDRVAAAGVSDDLAQAMEIANPKAMSVNGISRYLSKLAGPINSEPGSDD